MRITPWLKWWRKRTLKKRLPNGRVSPHFRHIEFWTHDGTPIPVKAIPGLRAHVLRFLEPMRVRFGPCTVMSGYRHKRYNLSIGGATDSQHDWDKHPRGVATDVIFATGTPVEWAQAARALRVHSGGTGGIGVYPRSGFLHIDSREYRADWRQ